MADDDKRPQVEQLPTRVGDTSAIGSANAPFVFFENAPVFGIRQGVGHITLTAQRAFPSPDGDALTDHVIVAHLRMGLEAALQLRNAIDGLISLAAGKPEGQAH
jgi:hypothetical protein